VKKYNMVVKALYSVNSQTTAILLKTIYVFN